MRGAKKYPQQNIQKLLECRLQKEGNGNIRWRAAGQWIPSAASE
jgi:hypothetical protein